jgi:hypothetical protein
MFSPLAFPAGRIIFDLTTHYPAPAHVALSPFELFREPLVIIAIADGAELNNTSYRGNIRRSINGNGPTKPEHLLRELDQELEDLRDSYPKALVHQLLLFEHVHDKSNGALPDGLVAVPPLADSKTTTMKTIMCDISSMLLAEMTTLAKSLQGLSTIESPKLAQGLWGQAGNFWPSGQSADVSRQNSQVNLHGHERDDSPAGSRDRSHDRMSMPAQLRSSSSYLSTPSISGRPTTPMIDGPTFDQLVGPSTSQPNSFASRFMTPNPNRDTSRDRVSVHGFGPGSASERSRSIGRGRVGIVIGSLYMNAGRWNDAMRDLVDGASIARNNLDHLWHAKALENILVNLLMLAWSGLEFQIPQVCYSTPPANPTEPNNRSLSLQALTALLPELSERILGLYARAANNTGESLPQLPFSETIIRVSKLLAAIHVAGGALDNDVLELVVIGTPLGKGSNLLLPRLNINPSRVDIVNILYRAFPSPLAPEQLPVVDRVMILGGIASVLGSLGYNRKKAMVIMELVTVLKDGLVNARLAGAAEMGVHPAAGLSALATANGNTNGAGGLDLGEGDIEVGVDSFLDLLSQVYGGVTKPNNTPIDDSDEAVVARIMHDATLRSFGGQALKVDILGWCIKLSEALPDFHGVVRFSADLLRTAGSGLAPGPRTENASPSMNAEGQVRLSNNISRTLTAASHMGVKNIAAEYWDEFLVRCVDLEPLPLTRTPIPHERNELPGAIEVASSKERNPFIYNPFLRTPDTAAVEYLLVSGEGAIFKVTLQNPYQFDVEIESIRLESEGGEFESANQKTVIGPYRSQILTVPGTPRTSGQLKITGCLIKIRGCRERRFPIFEDSWSPQEETKIKAIGLASILPKKDRPMSVSSGPVTLSNMIPPKPTSLGLHIIGRQPVVVVKSTTLSQSAVMILEGERQVFSITLENLSKDTPVDLLLFSFKDSTQAPLKAAMSDREKSASELYELELIFARKQALHWIQKGEETLFIAPGATATFDMEILGKPGLTSAVVQVDYAFLGVPHAEVENKFYTRQVSLPITVTVNASIELARMDVLPLNGIVPNSLCKLAGSEEVSKDLTPNDYCLLLLDLRNAWPSYLQVHLELADGGTIHEEILPGNTSRIMFTMRRMFLPNSSAAVPTLDPARARQFVVSTGPVSADSERATREAFWYREEILKKLRGTWSTKSGSFRSGDIELRAIRLTQRMVEAIKIEDVSIEIFINGEQTNKVTTDSFAEVKVKICNLGIQPVYPLLRIQPSIRNVASNRTLDLSKKFVWNGTLQEALPVLGPGEETETILGVTALCRGEFEISASVEERKVNHEEGEEERRKRADTSVLMDTLLGAKVRRIWHCRDPCLLVVTDADDADNDGEE